MPDIPFPLTLVTEELDERFLLGTVLFFPEFDRLATNAERLERRLVRNATAGLQAMPSAALHRRRMTLPAAVTVRPVEIEVVPPTRTPAWERPAKLTFHAVCWSHGTDAHLARVPTLGIEVAANRPEDLEELLPREVRAALLRSPEALDLRRLVWLQRVTAVHIKGHDATVRLPTPKQRAIEAEQTDQSKTPVLDQVATNLNRVGLGLAYELGETVERVAELLTGRHPASMLLVGPSGVGKTAAVRELVRRRYEFQLGSTPFYATSGARLVAGMTGFGMWQERCQQLWREASRQRAVLHLGNLVELMEVGKSEHNRTGIAGFLKGYVARGDLLAVAECTPEQIPVIEREDPHLLDVFRRIDVPEPDEPAGRVILSRYAQNAPGDIRKPLPAGVLDAIDRLHRRYATYSAYPGRPLRFLHNLLEDRKQAPALTPADVLAAFTRETGLPRVLLDPEVRLDLADTTDWFAARVLGQPEAVELIVDLMATVKAGLARPRRPIASLLFVGPTGVGKTEMAKALAEFCFGSRDRLTRFDMSEFADPLAAQRLVGAFGSEGLLTAKVREQPFALVLLDEFEKAHPLCFDLLLQVLGEGRLTDAAGRLADFRNTIVILTSNLGAESYQSGGFGFGGPGDAPDGLPSLPAGRQNSGAAQEHFVRAVEAFVRPEFFNRIDRLVPFAPLGEETVRGIAKRELAQLEGRDGVRYRGTTLDVGAGVADHLGRRGYDVRYGARPLKRAVERQLLAPLARQMNRYPADQALAAQVRLEGGELAVTVKPRTDMLGRPIRSGADASPLAAAGRRGVALRRKFQILNRCTTVRELNNDIFQLERTERYVRRKQEAGRAISPEEVEELSRLDRLRRLKRDMADLASQAEALEEVVLTSLYATVEQTADPTPLMDEARVLERGWADLVLQLYRQRFPSPDGVTLVLFAEERAWLFRLAAAYADLARRENWPVEVVAYRLPVSADPLAPLNIGAMSEARFEWWRDVLFDTGKPGGSTGELVRVAVEEPAKFLGEPRDEVLGLGLRVSGPSVYMRLMSEDGLHLFRKPTGADACLVQVSDAGPGAYLPPEGVTRRGFIGTQHPQRMYDEANKAVEDLQLQQVERWSGPLAGLLGVFAGERLRVVLEKLVAE